ncbi:MAG: hypothetical protein HPY66_3274 [Firmicutes bacterium]|nr:hypothetical protein [Bacillota bacterium]
MFFLEYKLLYVSNVFLTLYYLYRYRCLFFALYRSPALYIFRL